MADTNTINSKFQLINRLMTNIVVKQEKRAAEFETEEIYQAYIQYKMIIEGLSTLDGYKDFALSDLHSGMPHLDREVVELLQKGELSWTEMVNEGFISQDMYDYFYDLMVTKEKDKYEERNNYYRMLIGLPPIETDPKDYIMVDGTPIQWLTDTEIIKLKNTGRWQVILNEHPNDEYIRYIGKHISVMEAREAEQFEVLWVAENTESTLYREMFNRERKVFMKTYHSEYLTTSTDFNEAYELTTLKMRAVIYYIITTNSPQLDKTTYTKEESEVLFKENGLSFPKNMPSVYRDSVSFVLNYLISYKGTNHAVKYISETLFSGLHLYKYFMRKRHKEGLKLPLPEGTKPEDVYEVDFILRPFDATNVIDSKDPSREDIILSYDDVVLLDPRWRNTQELKDYIFSSEFSYVNSKYIALDNTIDLNEITSAISVMMRLIVEYKTAWNTTTVNYSGTRASHKFFDLWIYFIALYTTLVERYRVKVPDSVSKITKLLGFIMPEHIERIQVYWHWYFEMRDFDTALDDFPSEITTSDEFFTMLVKVDKSIGLANFLDGVMKYAKNFDEVKVILDIYRAVRLVNTVPDAFEAGKITDLPTPLGVSFADYLEQADITLYTHYEKYVGNDETLEPLILELDNMVQFLIDLFKQSSTTNYQLNNIINALNGLNLLGGGVSQYLLYLLKMFKAYTADFLSDTKLITLGEDYQYQLNIDQVTCSGEVTKWFRWNCSMWDWLEVNIPGGNPWTFKPVNDHQTNADSVYLVTPWGDVCIGR